MPKLGEFIGALLSDAAQARVRADLEVLKIAEAYSAHDLLKHLPVPRFRLPDITVDVPVLVSALEGVPKGGDRLFDQPTRDELTKLMRVALTESEISLVATAQDKVSAAVLQRAKLLFETGPQLLLSPSKVSGDLAAVAAHEVKAGLKDHDREAEKVRKFEVATKASLHALLLAKLVQSPSLQVIVASADIKSHGNPDSIVRVRLTITEDAYEVINRDEGQGFSLTPE